MQVSAKPRKRNPRGEGGRLREEIVRAATRLIDAAGAEAVTLRAVAREAGISAPSIYAHFDDRDEILDAVIQHCFAEMTAEIAAARDRHTDPVARLRAGCEAYLRFAERQPNRYSLLFRRSYTTDGITVGENAGGVAFGEDDDAGAVAFGTLVAGIADCVAAGRSTSSAPFGDAVALWTGLHGYASLHCTQTGFPWPAREATVSAIIEGLARLTGP